MLSWVEHEKKHYNLAARSMHVLFAETWNETGLIDNFHDEFLRTLMSIHWTLVTTTAFVPKDVGIKMNMLS